jgi:hypothetical protein
MRTLVSGAPVTNAASQLLWEPDYSQELVGGVIGTGEPTVTNGGLIAGRLWHTVQPPFVRGVSQYSRFSILTGSDVPGDSDDPYKPTGAMHVQLQPVYTTNDITVTATAAASSTDTIVTVSLSDAALLVYPGLNSAEDGDYLRNDTTGEVMRITGAPTNGVFPVLRGQESVAAAINIGDLLRVPGGDVNPSAGFSSRAEVYGRFATTGTAPAASWPDPVGSTRWYGISYYLPSGMDTTSGQGWWDCMQWKGQNGGSPPMALGIDWTSSSSNGQGNWKIEGTSGHPSPTIGPLNLGKWTRFCFGVHWDYVTVANGGTGWLEIYKDGSLSVAQEAACTMDTYDGGADPIYYKNGIYRTTGWAATHDVYISAPKIGTTLNDVFNP